MGVAPEIFDAWVRDLAGGKAPSLRQLGKISGVPVPTLSIQRTRAEVPLKTLLPIARGYGHHPLRALSEITGFEHLWPIEVDRKLQLTLIPTAELVKELFWRGSLVSHAADSTSIPSSDALVRWGDRIAGGPSSRNAMAKALGLSPENLVRQLGNKRMSVEQIIHYADVAEASPVIGLCAAGHLSLDELTLNGPSMLEILDQQPASDLWEEVESSRRHFVDTMRVIVAEDELHRHIG